MDQTIITLSATAAALIPVVMILTSLAKNYIDSKWSPLVALGFSLLGSFFLAPGDTIALTIFQAILMSLTASGLYSGGKAIVSSSK